MVRRFTVSIVPAAAAVMLLALGPLAARDLRPPARPNDPPIPSYFDLGPPPDDQPARLPDYVQESLDAGPTVLDGSMAGGFDDDMPSPFGGDD